ncbi:CotD family spore coat protein [Bacillus taeanensis]|uniref:Spore coat protein CotH n=1 Tax=Bacillus taeanensis TaxID=273032 RepID=A0A366XV56_9BACI|nr:CotD family spore coat protein [Bacillus taeanensis]RBW69458.1 spore coat protein CotH [Bacillus taeanensis]
MPMWPRPMRPIVHPTRYCTQHHYQHHVVPHMHPTHIQHQYHNIYHHKHYYPVTQSCCSDAVHQHEQCGRPPCC